ncbi:MAG: DUF1800 domain-containing protein [Opitutaceae bacterium]
MPLSLTPAAAWEPLSAQDWNVEAARHLLRRLGWTARPADVEQTFREGLPAALDRLLPAEPPLLPKPRLLVRFEENAPQLQRDTAKMSGEERVRAQRELQERSRMTQQELSIKWLQFAAQPESSAAAKWVLFLSDVYVVSAEKVRNPALLHEHFAILARHGFGPAPALTKAVSRSPAMVIYLDLQQSQLKAPNENFARELFELFVLGEGNYGEADIKEAARAFTGYRAQPQQAGQFRYVPQQHDAKPKTIFGTTGNFAGDDVIDLAYRQPAAATFLPRELVKFYLSDAALPAKHLEALGDLWRAADFDLRSLARQFFGSRLFFTPEFRGNFIKSPIQFYLGLVQDMELDVAPLPRLTLTPLRQMGQLLFSPPNVRGWVGGRNWINSATITARRQFVESLFAPVDDRSLNADEQIELLAARTNGIGNITVDDDALAPFVSSDPAEAATVLCATLLAGTVAPEFLETLRQFIALPGADEQQRLRRIRRATVTLMQSPEYQLC